MKKLKVLVVTTSRADYGLLYPLLKKMREDHYFDLTLGVTGSHLSELHGNTLDQILEDGFKAEIIISMTNEGDSEYDICSSIAKGLEGFSNLLRNKHIECIIVLGDRFELWAACLSAVIYKIPIVHIHGGESTYGLIDDPIRHSVTKMAALHFPSIELYGRRIIQMGENPEQVFIVGALGIDNIRNIDLMSRNQLSEFTNFDFNKDVALMTFHPVTLDGYNDALVQITEVLEALLDSELQVLITMPNQDTGGNSIYDTIQKYVKMYPNKFFMVKNLGQKAYLSAMRFAKLMIGNSSSGIIESASFRLPVVNIGDRQSGRFKPRNIIDCECLKEAIVASVIKATSIEFEQSICILENPYGDGNTSQKIVSILKSIDFKNKSKLLKKRFFDIKNIELLNISPLRIIK